MSRLALMRRALLATVSLTALGLAAPPSLYEIAAALYASGHGLGLLPEKRSPV